MRAISAETPVYGPLLNAIQDMWEEHNLRAQGLCGCVACKAGLDLFEALCAIGETKR